MLSQSNSSGREKRGKSMSDREQCFGLREGESTNARGGLGRCSTSHLSIRTLWGCKTRGRDPDG